MIPIFLWVVCCYTLAVIAVHIARKLYGSRGGKGKHYILVAGNQQLQMEWYIRSLRWFSRRTGTDVKITVIDGGSDDETLAIAEHFAKDDTGVEIRRSEIGGSERSSADGSGAMAQEKDRMQASSNETCERFPETGGPLADNKKSDEAAHWIWMLQSQGAMEQPDKAVWIDLRDPGDLSKLPM